MATRTAQEEMEKIAEKPTRERSRRRRSPFELHRNPRDKNAMNIDLGATLRTGHGAGIVCAAGAAHGHRPGVRRAVEAEVGRRGLEGEARGGRAAAAGRPVRRAQRRRGLCRAADAPLLLAQSSRLPSARVSLGGDLETSYSLIFGVGCGKMMVMIRIRMESAVSTPGEVHSERQRVGRTRECPVVSRTYGGHRVQDVQNTRPRRIASSDGRHQGHAWDLCRRCD